MSEDGTTVGAMADVQNPCEPGSPAPEWAYEFNRDEDRDVALCDRCGLEVDTEYVPGGAPSDLVATHPTMGT